jgi:putative membrane protein insertion efficiency factor
MAQTALLTLIGVYRRAISPLLPGACRFYPSCSAYAREAIETHGSLRGIALAGARLVRCHPWCEGGLDPVPSHNKCAHDEVVRDSSSAMKGRA